MISIFRSALIWLLAPLPRLPGAPLRFRKKLDAHHHETDHYAASITTADRLMSGVGKRLPGLLYHDFRFTWKGQAYRLYWNDTQHALTRFHLKRPYPVWIDPWDLTSVWFQNAECKVTPVLPEDDDTPDEDDSEGPLMAVDVQYDADTRAFAAGVLFDDWHRGDASGHVVAEIAPVAPYEPGAFYKRELPCILALLDKMDKPPCLIIVDGYVTLGPGARDGLGMHLYRALNAGIPVIGVAKNRFKDTPPEAELLRGQSKHPLFISAAGLSVEDAKRCIAAMHGPHRMPTILTAVDQLCRQGLTSTGCPSTPGD